MFPALINGISADRALGGGDEGRLEVYLRFVEASDWKAWKAG